MPNWCYNSITITGPREDVGRLLDHITVRDEHGNHAVDNYGGKMYDFSAVYPCPDELHITATFFSSDETSPEAVELKQKYEANIAKHGYPHWYEWCNAKWGTKWPPNVSNLIYQPLHDDKASIEAHAETAWSPASGLFARISEVYPTLSIVVSYDEESNAYIGAEAYRDGNKYERSYSLPPNPAEGMPNEWATKINDLTEKLDQSSVGSDEWDEISQELSDVYSDLRWECHKIVVAEVGLDGSDSSLV